MKTHTLKCRSDRVICGAIALGVLSVSVAAQQPAERGRQPVTLDAAIAAAMTANPDLGIALALRDSSRAELRIARAIPNPTALLNPNTPYQYNLSIPVDVGPQRVARVHASASGARASAEDVADARRQLTLNVSRAFYDVLLADARADVALKRREIVLQLLQADSSRARAGDIPERSVVRSELELARADADLTRAGIDRQSSRLTLQSLMGETSPDTALVVAGTLRTQPLQFDADSLVGRALAGRPDLAAGREREVQSRALQSLARSQLVPIPQLTFSRQFTAPFESGHFYSFGLGFEVPILNFYSGQRDRAEAGVDAASFARRRLEAQVRRDVLAAVSELRAQQALVRRYEGGLLTKVAVNVDATRYAYDHGAASLPELLDAIRAQQEISSDYEQALHDYAISRVALEANLGGPIR